MAVNKRKVLDAARKYAQKGAKEKALKEYKTLLKLDPKDAKLHLEIGDAHRRWGDIEEATAQYTRVAEQYKKDGFDARAVAVFKQILNLDPKRYSAYVALSDLYQRMGLNSEAGRALQAATDGLYKEGKKHEALELLRKMAILDPTNTTSRMKVAELLRQEGLNKDAVAEYEGVAQELIRQGAEDSVAAVYERIIEVEPDHVEVLEKLSRNLFELGHPQRAEPFARRALEAQPGKVDHYEFLCELYKSLNRAEELAETTRALARLYRERGDEDEARVVMQRLPAVEPESETDLVDDAIDLDAIGTVVEDEDEALGSRDDVLDEDFLSADDDDSADLNLDQPLSAPAAPKPSRAPDAASKVAATEGDPDQLLAEASVYLRYGKRDQALASLQAVLAQEPEHLGALEKLGETYAEGGDPGLAVETWTKAARIAEQTGDDSVFEILCDRITSLDPAAASELRPVGSASPDLELKDGAELDELEFDDEELVVEDEQGQPEFAPVEDEQGQSEFAPVEDEQEQSEFAPVEDEQEQSEFVEIEEEQEQSEFVEVEDEQEQMEFVEVGDELESSKDDLLLGDAPNDTEIDDVEVEEDGFEIEIDVEDGDDVAPEVAEAAPDQGGQAATTSERIAEELEEAEFYFQQELYDEAEALYRSILKLSPDHPSALLRLRELAETRGEDSGALSDPDPVVEVDPPTDSGDASALSTPTLPDDEIDVDIDDEDEADEENDEEREEKAKEEDDEDEDATEQEIVVVEPDPQPSPVTAADANPTIPLTAADANSTIPAAVPDAGSTFDLAAELSDAFDDDEPHAPPQSRGPLSTVEEGLDSVFSAFKRGVSETLSEGDYETRYDLGIAYREMELLDDAIDEFRLCVDSPTRRLDSLHMLGLCSLDQGRIDDAVGHLKQALATPGLAAEKGAGLYFDLGRAFEELGDPAAALAAYDAVVAADSGFPGVDDRINSLKTRVATAAPAVPADTDEFESFDDLVAEVEAESEEATPEVYESLDDVISEVEAEDAAEAAAEAEPEPEPEPPKKSRKKKKKKISFV